MRRHAKYFAYRIAQEASLRLPSSAAFGAVDRLADWWWRGASTDRLAVQRNLSIIRGAPIEQQMTSAREVFKNFGRYLVEFFTMHRQRDPAVHVEGQQHFREAQQARRGVIIATGHLGNWEVGAALLGRMASAMSVVALPHDDPRMDRLFNEQRRRCGMTVIPVGPEAAHRSLQCLREGKLLGILSDRAFDRHGMVVPLCSRSTTLPQGPALLSLRSRAPIVPTFLVREARWTFRLYFEPPIWPRIEGGAASVQSITRQYAIVLERYLRRFPEQWLMFQPVLT